MYMCILSRTSLNTSDIAQVNPEYNGPLFIEITYNWSCPLGNLRSITKFGHNVYEHNISDTSGLRPVFIQNWLHFGCLCNSEQSQSGNGISVSYLLVLQCEFNSSVFTQKATVVCYAHEARVAPFE